MPTPKLTRRAALKGLGLAACSAAAHPLMSTVAFAGSDGGRPLGDHRLIVVILRGAMDGLDVVRPVGDPDYAGYRPTIAAPPGQSLDNYFQLHPALSKLVPLWQAGELGFVHATSTPYRDKRSHFDGQDYLEAGTGMDIPLSHVKDGWMNRLLQAVPGLTSETGFAFGPYAMPLLHGPARFATWDVGTQLPLTAQGETLLQAIYQGDPLFSASAAQAIMLAHQATRPAAEGMTPSPAAAKDIGGITDLADYAAGRLKADTRIAAFSLTGWDTHRSQVEVLAGPLTQLQGLILALKAGLGADVWGKTLMLAMTEFGRTARENGSKGTDHGTAGAMVMAGGALKGGKVYGRWPGLADADLYQHRDLLPTSDVRSWAGWAMRNLYGFDKALIENTVFPGVDLGSDPGFLL